MTTDAVITAAGMVTALGYTASATTAAIRARLTRFREQPGFMCLPADPPRPGAPVLAVAATTDLPRGPDIAVNMLAMAVQDLVTSGGLGREELEEAKPLVTRPFTGPGEHHRELRDSFCARLSLASGVDSFEHGSATSEGHAAMLIAIGHAARAVTSDPETAWLIAGADCPIDGEILTALDRARRLKSRRNLDGYIPGEAASVLLVEHRARAEARGAVILAEIEAWGTGTEAHTLESGEPPSGEGLLTALTGACSVSGAPTWILCDMNGESYRAKEWGLSRLRAPKLLGEVKKLWHPADGYGDVGGATGGCLAALCVRSFARGTAPSRRAILFAGSLDGTRAALCLTASATASV